MVLRISVTQEQWMVARNGLSMGKNTFSYCLRDIVAIYVKKFDEIEKTILTLPSCVTKLERYNIHRFSCRNFTSESYDDENSRIIEITLSKVYLQDLFADYIFPTVIEIPIAKSDKQVLFDSLIGYISQNLNQEFQQYLNTI